MPLLFERTAKLLRLLGVRQTLAFARQWLRGEDVICFRAHGVRTPLYCRRSNSDIHVLWQIFGRREADFPLSVPPEVIIDAGANIGLTSLFLAQKYPGARIVAVEPDLDNCAMFARNCGPYPNIELIRAGLWSSDSALVIENPEGQAWSFRVTEAPAGTPGAFAGVTLPDIINGPAGGRVDLLKIDIEGAEREVFSAPRRDWIGQVKNLMIELHDSALPGCREAVFGAMEGRGFTVSRSGEYTLFLSGVS